MGALDSSRQHRGVIPLASLMLRRRICTCMCSLCFTMYTTILFLHHSHELPEDGASEREEARENKRGRRRGNASMSARRCATVTVRKRIQLCSVLMGWVLVVRPLVVIAKSASVLIIAHSSRCPLSPSHPHRFLPASPLRTRTFSVSFLPGDMLPGARLLYLERYVEMRSQSEPSL